jgi:hypothetical protein
MANIGNFDPTTVAPREDFSPIPSGEYQAQIVESDVKPTKRNDGHYAELTFELTAGEHKGRRVWARLNLDNPNPKAVEIAQRELSAICHAIDWLKPVQDTQVLHYKPMTIRVDFVPAGPNRDKPTNEIKAYKPAAGGLGNAPSAATPAPSSAAPPWGQRAA